MALLLITHGARIDARDRDGYTPLHWAALGDFEIVVRLLLSKGADANVRSRYGITPLIQAAVRGHLAVVEALLASGARANESTDEGWSALHKAIANGHYKVVEMLLDHGGDLLAAHPGGVTPFLMAQKSVHPAMRDAISQWARKAAAGRTKGADRLSIHSA
ncbi:MAG TPA: ankyrin repeat domain-containing protein [Burkholderiales bacterium]|nr:ankyrin repeat domain-containing protein [Burkholderiales bacterium]